MYCLQPKEGTKFSIENPLTFREPVHIDFKPHLRTRLLSALFVHIEATVAEDYKEQGPTRYRNTSWHILCFFRLLDRLLQSFLNCMVLMGAIAPVRANRIMRKAHSHIAGFKPMDAVPVCFFCRFIPRRIQLRKRLGL